MTDLNELLFPASSIKKSLKQPLFRIPPPWENFPDHAEEIFYLVSGLPRQAFEFPDNIAQQSIDYIERFTSDKKLRIEWIVNCSFDAGASSAAASKLFYKIEALVIRPIVRRQGAQIKTCFPIGTLQEIADAVNFSGDSLDKIENALAFGGSIKIELRIGESGKAKRKIKNKSEVKSKPSTATVFFNTFKWCRSQADFTEVGEPTGNIFGENICYLFPTTGYIDVLSAGLQIEKVNDLKQLSPFSIRLLEIFYWKALIEDQRKHLSVASDDAIPVEMSMDEISELFPLTDQTEFDKLVKSLESL